MTPRLYHIGDANTARLRYEMAMLNVSGKGIVHMVPKGHMVVFRVDELPPPAALILKQELLAKGGEAALAKEAILGAQEPQSLLLFATPAQYGRIIESLQKQDFGLPELARELARALALLAEPKQHIPYHTPYLHGQIQFDAPLVMGIVNLTPDSFYDGGRYLVPSAAQERIYQMVEEGADMIDLGGASSRPGHTPVSAAEELERVLPVLEAIAPKISVPISIDTDKVEVAEAALSAGAAIINDISGLPQEMAALAARTGAPTVLMHQGGGPDIMLRLQDFFLERINVGLAAGMQREQFILDPGLGFGKDTAENLTILRHLEDLQALGLPILIGLSNKRFIGAVLNAELSERDTGNLAASVMALAKGAAIIRTHTPREIAQAVQMVQAIREGVKSDAGV